MQTHFFLDTRRGRVTNQKEPRLCINCSTITTYDVTDSYCQWICWELPLRTTMTICCRFLDLPLLCLLLPLIATKLGSRNGDEFSAKLSEISERLHPCITVLGTSCDSEPMTHGTSVCCFTTHRTIISVSWIWAQERFHALRILL
jgi:hypothetical protein